MKLFWETKIFHHDRQHPFNLQIEAVITYFFYINVITLM
jgi:hypothetical protein